MNLSRSTRNDMEPFRVPVEVQQMRACRLPGELCRNYTRPELSEQRE